MKIRDLEEILISLKIPDDWYCFNGYSEGCYGIHFEKGSWCVHVCERGKYSSFEEFTSESEACQYLLEYLKQIYARL